MAPPLDPGSFEQLKADGDLPSPRGVALAIMRATESDDVSMPALGAIVKTDPAFAGRLIKAANGLIGYGRRPIASIQDALTVLGLPAVRSLALGFSLINEFRSGACAGFDFERFWSASVYTAVAMQGLTRRTRAAPIDEAYCIGLLARVGELALATLFPSRYDEVLGKATHAAGALQAAEAAEFAMTHGELGAAMLRDWGIPALYADAVAYHEDPGAGRFAVGTRAHTLTLSLAIARAAADACLADGEARQSALDRVESFAGALEIDAPALQQVCDASEREWQEWGQLLGLKHPSVAPFSTLYPRATPRKGTTVGGVAPWRPGRVRVLVADSDPKVREDIRQVLEQSGHDVQEAASAAQATEMALLSAPQLMLIDWTFADGCGMKVVERLRETRAGRGIYVLILTAHENEQRLIEAFESGVDDFMTKPVNARVLSARLRAGLRVVRLNQEIEQDREEMRQVAAELAVSNLRLQDVALSDALTGFPNRRYLMDRLQQEWAAALRSRRPLSCMVIDIDRFKAINETYGQDNGDAVLRGTAAALKQGLRAPDVIARLNGDGFIVLCPDTAAGDAEMVAERLRAAVAAAPVRTGMLQLRVTVSIGVAARDMSMSDGEALVKRAEQGLYVAKSSGRNRVALMPARSQSEELGTASG